MKNLKFPDTKIYSKISKAYSETSNLEELIELCFTLLLLEESQLHVPIEYSIAGQVIFQELTGKSYQSKIL